jgi:hypothetical protein
MNSLELDINMNNNLSKNDFFITYDDKDIHIIRDSFNKLWINSENICDILGYKASYAVIKSYVSDNNKKNYVI